MTADVHCASVFMNVLDVYFVSNHTGAWNFIQFISFEFNENLNYTLTPYLETRNLIFFCSFQNQRDLSRSKYSEITRM
jgi:hypothetical protein